MKKRMLAALLAWLCLLSACGSDGEAPAEPAVAVPDMVWDEELRRAEALGLILPEWTSLKEAVTGGEYFQMLTTVLRENCPEKAEAWQTAMQPLALSSKELWYSDGALGIYYAACHMGLGDYPDGMWNDRALCYQRIEMGMYHQDMFPGAEETSPFRNIRGKQETAGWNYLVAAEFWCQGQFSRVSGKTIFDNQKLPEGKDPNAPVNMIYMKSLSRDAAIRACLRLYESVLEPIVPQSPGAEVQPYLTRAEQRREAILSSSTQIVPGDTYIQGKTYTGKAYYVSSEGKDSNNGLTEQTPWATLNKVNRANLQPGDAVFFRRGDTWYGEILGKEQVTYSAYGEGEKPRFLGSDPGLSQAENWKEYAKSADGGTIWQYREPLMDASGIFFDGGWAEKVMPGWTGEFYCKEDGTPFVLEEGLDEDLTYFSCLDLTGNPMEFETDITKLWGPLYLRCDAGNPAQVLRNLHASMRHTGLSPDGYFGTGMTADNLSFYYYAGLGIAGAGYQGWTGNHIQNCEIGFCGGELRAYQESQIFGYGFPNCSGAAVHIAGSDNSVVDCYIHDCDNKSIVFGIHDRGPEISMDYRNLTIRGNLMERSGALLAANFTSDPLNQGSLQDILIEDNLIFHTSEGWFLKKVRNIDAYRKHYRLYAMDFAGLNGGKVENMVIRNNVFLGGSMGLVALRLVDNPRPIFQGNVYAQYENGWAADVDTHMIPITAQAEASILSRLGDTTGTTLVIR